MEYEPQLEFFLAQVLELEAHFEILELPELQVKSLLVKYAVCHLFEYAVFHR